MAAMKLAVWWMRQAGAASPVWARVGLLAAVVMLFGHGTRARAHDPDHPDVEHLRLLAGEKRVPVVVDPTMPLQATALIQDLS